VALFYRLTTAPFSILQYALFDPHSRKQLTCVTLPPHPLVPPSTSPVHELIWSTTTSSPLLHAADDEALLTLSAPSLERSSFVPVRTYLQRPHQQSYTLMPEISPGCATSVHPPSSMCMSCDTVPLAKTKEAQSESFGAPHFATAGAVQARWAKSGNNVRTFILSNLFSRTARAGDRDYIHISTGRVSRAQSAS
jgi:hypothetical protein